MRPLRYSINVTSDGCYDQRTILPDESLHHHAENSIAQADALLFGRVTYGMMEAAWRQPEQTGVLPDWMEPWMEPFARTVDAARKYVVSSTLDRFNCASACPRAKSLKSSVQLDCERIEKMPDKPASKVEVQGKLKAFVEHLNDLAVKSRPKKVSKLKAYFTFLDPFGRFEIQECRC